MRRNRTLQLYSIILAGFVLAISLFPTGCANIIAPTGGLKDTLPPMLVEVKPADSSRDFNTNKIVFTFNEYVQLDNIQQNLIVSPVPKLAPNVESKLRTVTVRLKDTLEANTTYSINFGNALKDVNEGNPLKNFTYVFATGKIIDSNHLSGKVILAETGKTDSTLIVMLYKDLTDSAVVKERPRYYTRLDGKGHFHFHNLPTGTFALYAMKDEGALRYLSPSQLFAFASENINTSSSDTAITLYAYAEEKEEAKAATQKPTLPKKGKEEDKDKRLKFTTSLVGNQQSLLDPLVIEFPSPLKIFDTTKIKLTDDKYEQVSNYSFTADTTNTKYTLNNQWKPGAAYHLIIEKGAAEDSLEKSILKTDTIAFTAMKESDYGSLRLRFLNPDFEGRNIVLQFVQSERIMASFPLSGNELKVKLFKPGEYDLRVLYDDNKNGVWDAGSFFKGRKQPEIVRTVDKKISIKMNWDNEVDITL